MRRIVGFIIASSLLAFGVFLLYFDLVSAARQHGRIAMTGGFLIAVGGAWLWADFIGPSIRTR